MMKKWGIRVLIGIAVAIGLFGGFYFYQQQKEAKITTFEQCQKAGYPTLESYPAQCRLPSGKSFTQNIGNALDMQSKVLVTDPSPNQKTTAPLLIRGKARGSWYFEGILSAELFDQNQKSLGAANLQANGEWMTEEFVPFEGELNFTPPQGSTGTLILKNANPSGLPENEKKLLIPLSF